MLGSKDGNHQRLPFKLRNRGSLPSHARGTISGSSAKVELDPYKRRNLLNAETALTKTGGDKEDRPKPEKKGKCKAREVGVNSILKKKREHSKGMHTARNLHGVKEEKGQNILKCAAETTPTKGAEK